MMRREASRRRVRIGDVFSIRMGQDRFVLGRVINDCCAISPSTGPVRGLLLVYIFADVFASEPSADRLSLTTDRLLFAPKLTNRQGWTHGFFKTIASSPVGPNEAFPRHLFRHWGAVYDEVGETQEEVEPRYVCGELELHSYASLELAIEAALAERPPG